MIRKIALAATLATSVLLLAACGSHKAASLAPTSRAKTFADRVDNPWFPLIPGTTLVYRGIKDGRPSRELLTVTDKKRTIKGVRCTVVRDRLWRSGRLFERTIDWYAQDADGNVWYFGEKTAELDENGRVKSTEGTWQAGVDGAQEGIFMPAHPAVGQSFRQEYLKGQAEDHFQVLNLSAPVTTPYLTSKHALLTKEWTPLEPGVVDHKLYIRGIGTVKEAAVKGSVETNILVDVRR
ncbi:MAG: hypothetical protein ABI896_02155 [Actinomycetota bacterium]